MFCTSEPSRRLTMPGCNERLLPGCAVAATSGRSQTPSAVVGYTYRAASEHVLCLDGEEAILFEYADETIRQADSDTVLPDGTFSVGHADLYFGRVMYWAKGRVIVNYSLGEARYWDVLTTALGETLTSDSPRRGNRPSGYLGSELCVSSAGP